MIILETGDQEHSAILQIHPITPRMQTLNWLRPARCSTLFCDLAHGGWGLRRARTFMTSTCRSSWRLGVTLMASRIWLNSCFSVTSVSTATRQSSQRTFCQCHRTRNMQIAEHEISHHIKKSEHWSPCHDCKLNCKYVTCMFTFAEKSE